MEYVKSIIEFMQAFLIFCNVCIMLYVFKGFVSKPHNNLEERVTKVELEVKDIKDSLKQGNDKFREQNETNEVLLNSTLALIEFEIQYCLTENKHISPELQKAKENLHGYLSKNR